jgi:uncharacterized protein YjbI with pentapeptide repeats
MANNEHVAAVCAGPTIMSKWRRRHALERLDLRGAAIRFLDLAGIDLAHADCTDADFSAVSLEKANLQHSVFTGARFDGASLNFADCEAADFCFSLLQETSLGGTNLSKANMKNANLVGTRFVLRSGERAKLHGCDLRGVVITKSTETHLTGGFFELAAADGLDSAKLGRGSFAR